LRLREHVLQNEFEREKNQNIFHEITQPEVGSKTRMEV
jgi:hypothetical protein